MAFKITGIRKPGGADNIHEAISHYRWQDDLSSKAGIADRLTVVGWVEHGIDAYVAGISGKAWCQVRQNEYGTKYLQTVADNRWANNLLALPQV